MLDLLVPLLIAITGPATIVAALSAGARRIVSAGHRVTVSLTDGSVLTGRTRLAWPGRVRLVDVETAGGEVPGVVLVDGRHVVTVQVIS